MTLIPGSVKNNFICEFHSFLSYVRMYVATVGSAKSILKEITPTTNLAIFSISIDKEKSC